MIHGRVNALPVGGCSVALIGSAPPRLGEVTSAKIRQGVAYATVAWGRKRKESIHPMADLCSGFQEGDTVQDVPQTYTGNSLGKGTVLQSLQIAGEHLIVVDFGNGDIRRVPFTRLRRIVDVGYKFKNQLTDNRDEPERFRLKCFAHALESWNLVSGALDRVDVDPLPHQIDVVYRIMKSDQTNWLIADDVGLGKTIEVGLLLAAKKRQRPLRRVLIVCPAGITRQWQDEMRHKFNEQFSIYGSDFTINDAWQWHDRNRVIVSIDLAKSRNHLPKLQDSGGWDIIIFDEAHHLSKREQVGTTQRYQLAQTLREHSNEFLFLTGTPHQGDDSQFVNLLSLLRPDLRRRYSRIYTDPSVVADVVLKNQKAAVTDALGNLLFKGQVTRRVEAEVSEPMRRFQNLLEVYLQHGYAASAGGSNQRRAIGFVMTIYRKLASSSIAAIETALIRRKTRLLGERTTPVKSVDYQEMRDAFNDHVDGIDDIDEIDQYMELQAGNGAFFENELREIDGLLRSAREATSDDLKLRKFINTIVSPVVRSGEKLLIFTEYRATQEYLDRALNQHFHGSQVALIHGGMDLQQKLSNIGDFNESSTFLISTEAGGEGLNLHHNCHLMVNYDIPWNPRKLVQRAGRLYRYGQNKRVTVFNLVVDDTFDNRSLHMMLNRVNSMATAMSGVDPNVRDSLHTEIMGELLERVEIASILADNTTFNDHRTQQDIDDALTRAREASEQQDRLFSNVAGYDPTVTRWSLQMSQVDVSDFLMRMLPFKGVQVRQMLHNKRVFEIELPEDLLGHYAEFGNRRVNRISADRKLTSRLKDVVPMDFGSRFFRDLIELAKSPEFGGEYAHTAGDRSGSFALFKLQWSDDQGVTKREVLAPIFLVSRGRTAQLANDALFGLVRNQGHQRIDASGAETGDREKRFTALEARAIKELSLGKSNLLHPNPVLPLATADVSPA